MPCAIAVAHSLLMLPHVWRSSSHLCVYVCSQTNDGVINTTWAKDGVNYRSIEYPESHPLYPHEIHYFENGWHLRTEFSKHSRLYHGAVWCFTRSLSADEQRNFPLARETHLSHIVHNAPHSAAGARFVYNTEGEHISTEFSPQHWCRDLIEFYQNEVLVRTEHRNSGMITYFANNDCIRVEYKPTSDNHGVVYDFAEGRCVKMEICNPHPNAGVVRHLRPNGTVCMTVYAETDRRHGEVLHHDENGNVARSVGASVRRMERAGLQAFVHPPDLCCPITLQIFEHPVVASDGHSYERDAIAHLLQTQNPISPMTRETLDPAVMTPNRTLQRLVRSHMDTALQIARAVTL